MVVSVSYPGASANVLVDSVMVILEQAINGVQDMRYMIGDATSAGEGTIQIIFEPGTDPNVAVLNVNNRIQAVKKQPATHRRAGGHHRHAEYVEHVDVCECLQHRQECGSELSLQLCHCKFVAGDQANPRVGRANILGNRAYAMRVELNLDRMRAYNVSSEDVMKAIADQSMIGSPGRLGQATGRTSQTVEYVLTWVGRYNKPEHTKIIS